MWWSHVFSDDDKNIENQQINLSENRTRSPLTLPLNKASVPFTDLQCDPSLHGWLDIFAFYYSSLWQYFEHFGIIDITDSCRSDWCVYVRFSRALIACLPAYSLLRWWRILDTSTLISDVYFSSFCNQLHVLPSTAHVIVSTIIYLSYKIST